MPLLLRYAAFAETPEGGNPAGVVLQADGMDDARMLAIAAAVGFSETAFLVAEGTGRYRVRYFSPRTEIPFCGHATLASAIALFERFGRSELRFATAVGEVPVSVRTNDGRAIATLVSVVPRVEHAPDSLVDGVLRALRWSRPELDDTLPSRIAFAGARHLILAVATRERLAALDYDFDALARIMRAHDLITVDLIWRETQTRFHARNPFPIGGVVEDPATGAAAAAFGGYLRALDLVELPATVEIVQGEDMGRPSLLRVAMGSDPGVGIRVSGAAVAMAPPESLSLITDGNGISEACPDMCPPCFELPLTPRD